MPTQRIFEHEGVLMRVRYGEDTDGVVDFHSVHVLDSGYNEVGPNLVPMLDKTIRLTGNGEGESLLSAIVGEIDDENQAQADPA